MLMRGRDANIAFDVDEKVTLPTNRQPTLYLLCGLPGAGKTTLAMRLVKEGGCLRLAEDDWLERLFTAAAMHDEAARERIKAVQWEVAAGVLALGVDVVLDWGFWGRDERDDARARAAALGASCRLVYLAASEEELWRRLDARNRALPAGSFPVSRNELREWTGWFQPPAPDEAANVVTDPAAIPLPLPGE
jgi:predicted kinase